MKTIPMNKLLKYSQESKLMEIEIRRGSQKPFKFNLHQEVKINEDGIDKELMNQPSAYGFLTLLHKELIAELSNLKIDEKKAYAHAYLTHKAKINPETHRPNSDDVAKQKAELNIKYLKSQRKVIALQHQVSKLDACVKAFETRGSMLHTLSANKRKENN